MGPLNNETKAQIIERANYYKGLLGKMSREDMAALGMVIGAQLGSEYRHLKDNAETGVQIANKLDLVFGIAKVCAVALGFKGRDFEYLLGDEDEDEADAA